MTAEALLRQSALPVPANIAMPEKHPRDSALFGIATDGLPIYLHFGDPRPGPILAIGNPTPFLRCVVQTAASSGAIVLVITIFPEIWNDLGERSVIIKTDDYDLNNIANGVMSRPIPYPRLLVVIDRYSVREVEALDLICLQGPLCGVWPIVAVDRPAEVSGDIRPLFGTLVVADKANRYRLYRKKETLSSPRWAIFPFFIP